MHCIERPSCELQDALYPATFSDGYRGIVARLQRDDRLLFQLHLTGVICEGLQNTFTKPYLHYGLPCLDFNKQPNPNSNSIS